MNLRLAKKTDILDMVEIVKKTFSKEDVKSAKEEFAEMFSKSVIKPIYVVAVEKEKIIGFAGYIPSWFDFNIYEVFWVAVSPDFQKKGIGKEIMEEVIRQIKLYDGHAKAYSIILSTSSPNFFKKCGFKTISDLPNDNGVIMTINID